MDTEKGTDRRTDRHGKVNGHLPLFIRRRLKISWLETYLMESRTKWHVFKMFIITTVSRSLDASSRSAPDRSFVAAICKDFNEASGHGE